MIWYVNEPDMDPNEWTRVNAATAKQAATRYAEDEDVRNGFNPERNLFVSEQPEGTSTCFQVTVRMTYIATELAIKL